MIRLSSDDEEDKQAPSIDEPMNDSADQLFGVGRETILTSSFYEKFQNLLFVGVLILVRPIQKKILRNSATPISKLRVRDTEKKK